jgi:hypothetical protein
MALKGHGVLAIWHGIPVEAEREYWRWHDREHVPERVGVPGFLRGRRYRHALIPLRYLDFYEVESPDTLGSAPYLARLNDPTAWTRKVVPFFRDTARFGFRVVATEGLGQGGLLVTARVRPAGSRAEAPGPPPARLAGEVRRLAGDPAALLGVHLLETVAEVTRIPTAERRLRNQQVAEPDVEPEPWLLLAEVTDAVTAGEVRDAALGPAGLRALGLEADGAVVDTFRLQLTMDPG